MTPRSRSTTWIRRRRSIRACSRSTSPITRPRRVSRIRLSLTTWNINSVRLRIDLVAKFIKAARPDVLCLQETKCIDDAFPLKRLKRLGYAHVALNWQKGYYGVAIERIRPSEKADTCWSDRGAECTVGNRGRRLDHIWLSRALKDTLSDCNLLHEARGWRQPSDHVPVTVTLEL